MELKVARVVGFSVIAFLMVLPFFSSCLMCLVIALYVSHLVVFYVQSVNLIYQIFWIMRQNLY
jgi:hypothetical protein